MERGISILALLNTHSNLSKNKFHKPPLTVENVQLKCLKLILKIHNVLALKIRSHSLGGLLLVQNNLSKKKLRMNLQPNVLIVPKYLLDCRLKKVSLNNMEKNLSKKKRTFKPLKLKENWKSLSFMGIITKLYIKVRWIWEIANKLSN